MDPRIVTLEAQLERQRLKIATLRNTELLDASVIVGLRRENDSLLKHTALLETELYNRHQEVINLHSQLVASSSSSVDTAHANTARSIVSRDDDEASVALFRTVEHKRSYSGINWNAQHQQWCAKRMWQNPSHVKVQAIGIVWVSFFFRFDT
eukprot:GHVU01022435.1.p1 GENE.GHVU01022435.1~~GHVU01022435.1.p1  ORF type:complete len:152 (-),score=2.22 GHVU01022435.1:104-559(-)